MAPVSLEGRSRGQLILIGGLSLAIILVALALILNTAIFTENLASRNDDAIAGQAIGFQENTRGEIRVAMEQVNAKSTATASSYGNQETFVFETVNALDSASGQYAGQDGAGASVVLTGGGITEGSRLYQDSAGEFVDDTGAEDWTVATGVTNPSDDPPRIRDFEMTVDRSLLADDTVSLSGRFKIQLDASLGSSYTVYIYQTSSPPIETVVEVSGPISGICSDDTGSSTVIDITDATVGGDSCPVLEAMWEDPSSGLIDDNTAVEIRYEEADKVEGTYSLLVGTAVTDDTRYSDNTNAPENKDLVYSTEMRIQYRTAGVNYATTVRVAPGEYDD